MHTEWAKALSANYLQKIDPKFYHVTIDDVEQSALIGLWNGLRLYEQRFGNLQIFLRLKIRCAIIDACRKTKMFDPRLRRKDPVHVSSFEIDPKDGDGSTLVLSGEIKSYDEENAYALIQRCEKEQHQTVLFLRYLEGLSYEEIGLAMGLCSSRIIQIEREACAAIRRRFKTEQIKARAHA